MSGRDGEVQWTLGQRRWLYIPGIRVTLQTGQQWQRFSKKGSKKASVTHRVGDKLFATKHASTGAPRIKTRLLYYCWWCCVRPPRRASTLRTRRSTVQSSGGCIPLGTLCGFCLVLGTHFSSDLLARCEESSMVPSTLTSPGRTIPEPGASKARRGTW